MNSKYNQLNYIINENSYDGRRMYKSVKYIKTYTHLCNSLTKTSIKNNIIIIIIDVIKIDKKWILTI